MAEGTPTGRAGRGPSTPAGTREDSRHVQGREHRDWRTRHPRVSSGTEFPHPQISRSIGTAAWQDRNASPRHLAEEFRKGGSFEK